MPMMPFMGVRISWLIVARNSLLARFDASACSLAILQIADGLRQLGIGLHQRLRALLHFLLEAAAMRR